MRLNSISKKAVVTGGAGFIGSHITEEMVRRGWRVIIIDDLSSGKIENVQHLLKESQVDFVRGSISDLPLLQNLFAGADYIFHEAAIASVPASIDNPPAAHEVNITGSLNVLLAARDNKVQKVVCASSAAVYGNDPILPKEESMLPDPQSPYAVTKLAMEYYCRVFLQVYHLPTVCLRYFNVFGPRQNPNSDYAAVIPKFVQKVKAGQPPLIFGDGEQSRDFIFVNDVAAANLLAAESQAVGVFNIASGQRVNLNQLAQIIIELSGNKNLHPVYGNERQGDIKHSLADIRRAGSFGFHPQYGLREGLKELI